MRRVPALSDDDTGIDREIGSHFDTIKIVADNIDAILEVSANSEYTLKYLGASESSPSERQDGSPIKDGDYFFDTVKNLLVYYDLTEDLWYDIDPAAIKSYSEAAQAAQTVSEAAQATAITEANKAKTEADRAKTEADRAASAQTLAELVQVSNDFIIESGNLYNVTAKAVGTLPNTLVVGEYFYIHAEADEVDLDIGTLSVTNGSRVVPTNTYLRLNNGDTAEFVAVSTSRMELK